MQVPAPIKRFFSMFPLHTYPAIETPKSYLPSASTLWIHPPHSTESTSVLSSDVECLKWQAYVALRGLSGIHIRHDVDQQGAIDARLPNLHVKDAVLLPAHSIPGWVDEKLGVNSLEDTLEGYRDEATRDESRAWVSLLEGNVHAALILDQPAPAWSFFFSLESPRTKQLQSILTPPPPPLPGLASLLPPFAIRVSPQVISAKYSEAIGALSERLGTDKWFLGSDSPTPLDALLFAYLHCLLHSKDPVRAQITRHVNLVAWEWRVRGLVSAAFSRPT